MKTMDKPPHNPCSPSCFLPFHLVLSEGVPEVLAGLFDGSRNGDNSAISSHEKATTGNSVQLSSGGLPSTIKTLLMSSSYRVRSATAQLIATLCSDKLPTEPEAQENVIYGVRGGGCFFRETLLAAGTAGKCSCK